MGSPCCGAGGGDQRGSRRPRWVASHIGVEDGYGAAGEHLEKAACTSQQQAGYRLDENQDPAMRRLRESHLKHEDANSSQAEERRNMHKHPDSVWSGCVNTRRAAPPAQEGRRGGRGRLRNGGATCSPGRANLLHMLRSRTQSAKGKTEKRKGKTETSTVPAGNFNALKKNRQNE